MKRIAILCALLLLAGCATEPISTRDAHPVPRERVLAADMTKPQEGMGSLIVKRDAGLFGSACTHRLFINGTPFADIDTEEKVQIYLAPGEHILGSKPNGICGGGNVETAVNLKAGQTRTYRAGVGSSGDIALQPTAF